MKPSFVYVIENKGDFGTAAENGWIIRMKLYLFIYLFLSFINSFLPKFIQILQLTSVPQSLNLSC